MDCLRARALRKTSPCPAAAAGSAAGPCGSTGAVTGGATAAQGTGNPVSAGPAFTGTRGATVGDASVPGTRGVSGVPFRGSANGTAVWMAGSAKAAADDTGKPDPGCPPSVTGRQGPVTQPRAGLGLLHRLAPIPRATARPDCAGCGGGRTGAARHQRVKCGHACLPATARLHLPDAGRYARIPAETHGWHPACAGPACRYADARATHGRGRPERL